MKIGDLVHYIPFENCPEDMIENGKVKSFNSFNLAPFIVFHCNNEWDKWMDYTAEIVDIRYLKLGWYESSNKT